ncbi:MAG: hypothetical protein HXX13_12870 [Bacteroidetes bacterium]|nr:hypothetical protein [Bacteroidota bacterium]
MKSCILFCISAALIVLTSCSAQFQARNYDDVYYSSKNKPADEHSFVVKPTKVEPAQAAPASQDNQQSSTVVYADSTQSNSGSGGTTINNNYYGDDYYDYAYSARLRRFHDDFYYNNYYSDYYTNSYWYDNNPWNWGVSIYMGYNWWYPSFYSRWGWPYSSWDYGYNSWGYPYSNYGYGGYSMGYYDGFYDGYWHGNWEGNNYYNSYDDNSHHYGRRHSTGSNGMVGQSRRDQSFAERYENRMAAEKSGTYRNSAGNDPTNRRNGRGDNSDVIASGTDRTNGSTSGNYVRGSNEGQTARNVGRSGQQDPVANNATQRPTRYIYQGSRNQNRPQPTPGVRNQSNIQPYSSPAYSKPRSSQEYTAPKYRNSSAASEYRNTNRGSGNNGVQQTERQGSRGNVQPSSNPSRNSYSTPERTYENRSTPVRSNPSPSRSNEGYTPSRSNNSYSAPSRSTESSSPARSNSSYSAPSRSSESSSPSRSSGSSGSGSSGSGSGSGRRR